MNGRGPRNPPPVFRCNFCGKRQEEVWFLYVGKADGQDAAYICDECIELVSDVYDQRRLELEAGKAPPDPKD